MEVCIPRRPADPDAPRLAWPGRRDDALVVPGGTPTVRERWGPGPEPAGRVLLGDNLPLLASLPPRSVRLCYLDPPFFSGERYAYRTQADGRRFEVPAFTDAWRGGLAGYLSFLEDRLRLVARALTDDGSLYVHLDAHAAHYAKVLLDEILGPEVFARQIIWRIGWVSGFKSRARNWVRNHDVLLYYARPGAPFHRTLLPPPRGYVRRGGGAGRGRPLEDVWTDLPSIQIMSFSGEKTGWATQKNEALLRRLVAASSDPGDVVLDPFAGAGSTAVAAADLDRRFVVMDASPLAVHLCRRRLLAAGRTFTVEGGDSGPAAGLHASAHATADGLAVRLEDAPEAAGPDGVPGLARLDAWWVAADCAPERPLWHALRTAGRRPGRVPSESDGLRLPPGKGLRVTAVDLSGALHRAHLPAGDPHTSSSP